MKHLLLIVPLLGVLFFVDCSTPMPHCLKSNCNGCCDLNGACAKGNEQFACGFGANMCKGCAQNEACVDGDCVAGDGGTGGGTGSDGGCGPANCGGGRRPRAPRPR